MLERLNGIFAFALYDAERDEYLIARDPIGVIPLYIGKDKEGHICVASELKALEGICTEYEPFLPGHFLSSRTGHIERWWTRDWFKYDAVKDNLATPQVALTVDDNKVHYIPYSVTPTPKLYLPKPMIGSISPDSSAVALTFISVTSLSTSTE